jgi:RNA polymerase sigma-70 factor (sigma-E family)
MMSVTTRARPDDTTDRGRLADLYARHAPAAGRLAYLLTGDAHLAEDLTQEAFVRAFGRYRDLRRPDAFEWYLRRTVVNLSRSYFRRRRTERDYLAAQPRRETVTPAADPTEQDAMWRMLQTLPARQRAAIVLRYYEDLSDAQAADALRCPVGTVKSLIHRGLARLRTEVSQP